MATTSSPPLTLHEVELAAKAKLHQHIYEFYASGSDDEKALCRNGNPLNHHDVALTKEVPFVSKPRVLIDVSRVDTSAKLFGWSSPLPISIAPSAMQKLAGGQGELDVAMVAASMGVNVTLSSQWTPFLKDVQATRKKVMRDDERQAPPPWMQLYLYEDVKESVNLIRRVEALVLTVDTPVLGKGRIWDCKAVMKDEGAVRK
ncbi:L-lactate dehydrogenase (cytochrome) [Fusarium circinatum]|uniref:L-lactate dehydrogenase (Cytochrome) n=1 Tax=Fusarium circinatum TaxID=48490 RepID=A0A8H5TS21_FUSCI|nr:L-lactate dehydrogenase (cytochrome) [Fusarium circinatum]